MADYFSDDDVEIEGLMTYIPVNEEAYFSDEGQTNRLLSNSR